MDNNKSLSPEILVEAACQVLASVNGGEAEDCFAEDCFDAVQSLHASVSKDTDSGKRYEQVLQMASVMAASLQVPMSDENKLRSSVDNFCKIESDINRLWLFQDYMKAFD